MLYTINEENFMLYGKMYNIPDIRYQHTQLKRQGIITGENVHIVIGHINTVIVNYDSLYLMEEQGYSISDKKRELLSELLQDYIEELQQIGFCF